MSSNSLLSKLASSLPKGSMSATMEDSSFADKQVVATTDVPVLNIMLSSMVDGGIIPGITQLVGDSRTFKSLTCLVAMAAYLNTYPDAVAVFFDSEFGASKKYFTNCGIDMSRVLHIPVVSVEDFKVKVSNILDSIEADQKVFMFLDSVSQLASDKEIADAMDGDIKVDMTRAKAINSVFRIITPKLSLGKIPFFFINSYYDDISNKYAEKNIKGGKQAFLSSDTLLLVTRSQEKARVDGKEEFVGWNFNYTILKSRWVHEKSKFTITVTFNEGIDKWSGLMDIARDGGFVEMPTSGFYTRTTKAGGLLDDKKYRLSQCNTEDFWLPIVSSEEFKRYVKQSFSYDTPENGSIINDGSGDDN